MKKYFHDQIDNNNMTANGKKGTNQSLLFDAVPIKNYTFSLLDVEIGVGNEIVEIYFLWITEKMEKKFV